MPTRSIDTWHIVISGFTQDVDQMTGLMRLALELGHEHRGPVTSVELRRWYDDWSALAEWIHLARNGQLTVCIYAYSYGAGWGFTHLARELRKRNIRIRGAVLSDPVYRSPFLSGRWRSVAPFLRPTITIPDNVERVWSFRQNSLAWWKVWDPRGHRVKAADPERTTVTEMEVEGVTHAYLDDYRGFHQKALEVARAA